MADTLWKYAQVDMLLYGARIESSAYYVKLNDEVLRISFPNERTLSIEPTSHYKAAWFEEEALAIVKILGPKHMVPIGYILYDEYNQHVWARFGRYENPKFQYLPLPVYKVFNELERTRKLIEEYEVERYD